MVSQQLKRAFCVPQKARFAIPGPAPSAPSRRNLFSTSSLGSGLVPTRCPSKEVMYVCGPRLGLSERLIARAMTETEERQMITGSGSPGFLIYPQPQGNLSPQGIFLGES